MNKGKTIFAQVMEFLPMSAFRNCVARYGGEHNVRTFTSLDQFLCLAFAQLTYRESLRDIETCLRAMRPKLYHMGIRGKISRARWPTPTRRGTGASTPNSPRCSSPRPGRCTPERTSAWRSTRRSTPWTRRPSTCACRFSRGPGFARPRRRSNCTRCWTCGAASPNSSISPTAKCTMSTSWTC